MSSPIGTTCPLSLTSFCSYCVASLSTYPAWGRLPCKEGRLVVVHHSGGTRTGGFISWVERHRQDTVGTHECAHPSDLSQRPPSFNHGSCTSITLMLIMSQSLTSDHHKSSSPSTPLTPHSRGSVSVCDSVGTFRLSRPQHAVHQCVSQTHILSAKWLAAVQHCSLLSGVIKCINNESRVFPYSSFDESIHCVTQTPNKT